MRVKTVGVTHGLGTLEGVKTMELSIMTSDWVVDREVEVCLLLSHANGKCDFLVL